MSRLKYVKITVRNGVEYHYVRFQDQPLVALTTAPGTPDYFREYAAALESVQGINRSHNAIDQNRLDRRVDTYLRSAETMGNDAGVRSVKRKHLRTLIKGHEHEHPSKLTWDYIKRVRDEKYSTTPTRNDFVRYVTAFLNEMVAISVIPFNPVPRGRKARLKHSPTPRDVWRIEHFRTFRAYWPIGSEQRLAFELFYNTAQRCITICKLGPENLRAGKIVIDLSLIAKDNDPVGPKIRPMTAEAIEAMGQPGKYFLPGRGSDAMRSKGAVSKWFSKACLAAGLPKGFTAHGIRHGVMTMLAERGFSAEQIQSLTGHKSLQMILHYTKAAKRGWMTSEAVDGLDDDWAEEPENLSSGMENWRSKRPRGGDQRATGDWL